MKIELSSTGKYRVLDISESFDEDYQVSEGESLNAIQEAFANLRVSGYAQNYRVEPDTNETV